MVPLRTHKIEALVVNLTCCWMSCHSSSSLGRFFASGAFLPGLAALALQTCMWLLLLSATAICPVMGCHARHMRGARGSEGLISMYSCSL